MNENTKTVSFLLVAVVVLAVAWFSRPVPPPKSDAQVVGKKLFPDFTTPGSVDSLKVLQFDQKDGKSVALEVAKIDNLWVIPSHGKYPADAREHLAVAANSLIDLKILGLAPGFSPGSASLDDDSRRAVYNQYGVVDPDPADSVKSSDTGVGTHITMKDASGHELAAAIIGKPVPDQQNQCYVRVVGKEPVYIVELDPSKISVRFADWIEPNLLNLNSMDLKEVHINDYSIQRVVDPDTHQAGLARVPNGEYRLDLPSGDQPWKLVEDLGVDEKVQKIIPRKMAADEELNTATLDGMKTALEDLKIVDVERKPAAIPADLRVRSMDDATRETLLERGYYAIASDSKKPDAPLEIVSKFGEVDLQLNDGARYVLRFGNTTGESSADAKDKKADAKDSASPGMDRYLFVMAEFNQDAIPKPVVEQLPPEEKPVPKAEDKKAGAKAGEAKQPADAKKDAETKKDPAKKDDATKPGEAKPAETKKDEGKKEEGKKAEAGKDAAKGEVKKEEPKPADAVTDAQKAELRKAEQERIDKENQRRKDEYEAKVAAGKKHVKELNARFAQWYYVISGDVYEKIRLDHKAIVKKKEPKDAHDHEHEHEHEHGAELPVGPAGALDKVPGPEKK